MLTAGDESQDLRNRRVFVGPGLDPRQTLDEDPGAVEKILIERPHRRQPLARELATPHPDHVEALEHGILAVDETIGNDVVADAADAANHDLGADPGELVHGGQSADVDEVPDFAM